jgi:flagellar hook-associated protein 3 FlgL
MRIDSITYFNSALAGMRDNQSAIARLNQQLAADQRLLQPKDDPVATEEVLQLSNRVAARTQYANNQDRASIALKYESTVLSELRDTLVNIKDLLAGTVAGSDTSLRGVVAQKIQGLSRQVLDLANTRDPSGNYIFGGFDTVNRPFANPLDGTLTATTYGGTPNPGGTRSIEVEVGRFVQVNDNLDAVFQHGVAGSDLLQELDDAATNLDGATVTQADITGWMALVQTALGNLDAISYRVTAAHGEVDDVRTTSKALKLIEQNALSDLQSLDKASAILELQTRQTALEAAQRAYAMTSDLSLFNFLG